LPRKASSSKSSLYLENEKGCDEGGDVAWWDKLSLILLTISLLLSANTELC